MINPNTAKEFTYEKKLFITIMVMVYDKITG
jgi:hypothetical protein